LRGRFGKDHVDVVEALRDLEAERAKGRGTWPKSRLAERVRRQRDDKKQKLLKAEARTKALLAQRAENSEQITAEEAARDALAAEFEAMDLEVKDAEEAAASEKLIGEATKEVPFSKEEQDNHGHVEYLTKELAATTLCAPAREAHTIALQKAKDQQLVFQTARTEKGKARATMSKEQERAAFLKNLMAEYKFTTDEIAAASSTSGGAFKRPRVDTDGKTDATENMDAAAV
jgi:hypothetical protein